MVKFAMLEKARRKGDETRERILAVAESAVLAKGFSATSIEEIIAEVGITKSGFFYHFKDKGELAKGLLVRYLDRDTLLLDEIFRRGDELHTDPLHGFLIALKLFAEMMSDLPKAHPGCLAAFVRLSGPTIQSRNTRAKCRRRTGVAKTLSREVRGNFGKLSSQAGNRP